jgi:hypothetical protein
MVLYWMHLDSHDPVPWAIAAVLAIAGFWLARAQSERLVAEWDRVADPT